MSMPGMPQKERVSLYIDGFNLYFGVSESGLGRFLWLNLESLALSLLKPHQELSAVKYFTSRITGPPDKQHRQNTYLDALGSLDPNMLSIYYGNYQSHPRECRKCGKVHHVENEKQTDVNIAVSMLVDASKNSFDTGMLVTGDSDLCPVLNAMRDLYPKKRIIVAFPPGRGSKELAALAACMTIGRAKLAQSQFEKEIKLTNGYTLKKPPLWDTEDY